MNGNATLLNTYMYTNINININPLTSIKCFLPSWVSFGRNRGRRSSFPVGRRLCRSSTTSSPWPYNYLMIGQKQVSVLETATDAEAEEAASSPESLSRRLVLLRHADSSWDNPSLRDHDRPLSEAGQADAANISHKLQELGWMPQLILSSDAVRTRETLKIMQEQVPGFLSAEVHLISSFYSIAAMDGQTAEHLQQTICRYSRDDILTIMCMGHNRGWEEAASMFTGASVELKTCNAALLEAAGKSWEEAFTLAGLGGWKLQGIVKPSISP